jgi:hypothetical protein
LANRQTAVYFPNYIRTRLRVGYGTSGPTTAGATTDLFWRQAPMASRGRKISAGPAIGGCFDNFKLIPFLMELESSLSCDEVAVENMTAEVVCTH